MLCSVSPAWERLCVHVWQQNASGDAQNTNKVHLHSSDDAEDPYSSPGYVGRIHFPLPAHAPMHQHYCTRHDGFRVWGLGYIETTKKQHMQRENTTRDNEEATKKQHRQRENTTCGNLNPDSISGTPTNLIFRSENFSDSSVIILAFLHTPCKFREFLDISFILRCVSHLGSDNISDLEYSPKNLVRRGVGVLANQTQESTSALSRCRTRQGPREGGGGAWQAEGLYLRSRRAPLALRQSVHEICPKTHFFFIFLEFSLHCNLISFHLWRHQRGWKRCTQ